MSDKLYIQDLVNLLSEKQNISKKEAESFLKAFFSLIEEGLDKDKSVKIKGLGTFKLIRVESRESIDVNTGKRCIIEGHTKVTFNPDATVKDIINKPFSHFETVILNENVFFDEDESKDKNDSEQKEVVEPISLSEEIQNDEPDKEDIQENLVTEEMAQTNEVIEGSATVNVEEEEQVVTNNTDDLGEEIIGSIESINDEELTESSSELSLIEEVLRKENDNELIAKEEPKESFISQEVEQTTDMLAISVETNNPEVKEEWKKEEISLDNEILSDKRNKSNFLAYICIACVTAFITVCIVYFIFNPDIFSNLFSSSTHKSIQQELIENPIPIEMEEENIEMTIEEGQETEEETERRVEEEHALIHNEQVTENIEYATSQPKPEDILSDTTKTVITGVRKGYENVKADSTSYRIVGTMATHTIRGGETLTKVSNTYYGTKDLWPYLVMHNRKIIINPDNVPSGTKIRIPALRDK